MKKFLFLFVVAATFALTTNSAMAKKPAADEGCVAIKDGVLEYSAGHYLDGMPLTIGYDDYGYNYQAHMFNGDYSNAYLGRPYTTGVKPNIVSFNGLPAYDGNEESYVFNNPRVLDHWVWEYRNTDLMMKWNDAWLANTDCNNDGVLDRHVGYPTYIGSGAWLTNHERGSYEGVEGEVCKYTYFVKIVAAPDDANKVDGFWYSADGTEIGPVIWGSFAITQEVWNDSCEGVHGLQYLSPLRAGLGNW